MAAETTVLQRQTIATASSNWSQTVTFAPFNPALGTLVDVQVGITAAVTGTVSLENLGATAGTVDVSQSGTVSVFGPDGAFITSANPDATGSAPLAAFDGSDNYAGPSGTTLSDLSNTVSALDFYKGTTSELALFSGHHRVALTVDGVVGFGETGLANLDALSGASAGAVITLQYDYITPGGSNGGGGTSGSVTTIIVYPPMPPLSFTNSVTTTPQTFTVADATTGWTDDLSVARFDPTLGTLEAVNITLTGNEAASIGAENLDAVAASVSATETATLTLVLPNILDDLTVAPTVTGGMSLAGFDGTRNFAGPSGELDQGLTATANGQVQLLTTDLTPFIGTGTISLPLSAVGASSLTGPGNLLTQLLDQAGAGVTVSYTYLAANTDSASCFAAGTRIATTRGEVSVETLRPGDQVRCVLGDDAEVIWIGRRQIDCARHAKPTSVWPVRVCAGAFADRVPVRDVLLSPDHSVFVNDVLIPVKHLINGTTVVQEQYGTVMYYHVELPRHDVLLANGLAAESYLDTGDRVHFANGGNVVTLHPELTVRFWEAYGCAPLCVTGPEVDAVRARLATRGRRRGASNPQRKARAQP